MYFGLPIVSLCKESCLLAVCGVVLFNSFWLTDISAVMAVLCPIVQSDISVFMFYSE
jgi:hypothetical protein